MSLQPPDRRRPSAHAGGARAAPRAHGFEVAGQAADGEEAIEPRPRSSRTSSCSTSRCRGWTGSPHCRACARPRPRARSSSSPPRHRGQPARRDPWRSGRLPAEERAARADRRVPPRRRPRRGRALGCGSTAAPRASARRAAAAARRRAALDRGLSAPASSRCCSCSTSGSTRTRSRKRLFISEHTVRSHVKSVLAKLGVSSRREAIEALAAARG